MYNEFLTTGELSIPEYFWKLDTHNNRMGYDFWSKSIQNKLNEKQFIPLSQ